MAMLRFARGVAMFAVAGLCSVGMTGCSLSDLVGQSKLPPDQRDPDALKTPTGAYAAYQGVVVAFEGAIAAKSPRIDNSNQASVRGLDASYNYTSALFTDEMIILNDPVIVKAENGFPTSAEAVLDDRNLPYNDATATGLARGQYPKDLFSWLQTVRTRAEEARGALVKYAPAQPKALVGHLYAMQGYSEVLLAEMFCSGIPLSDLVFEGDFRYTRGYTTEEVLQHALAQFDSALALSGDSTSITTFAKMGRARALLQLGDYTAAAQAVTGIPDTYKYALSFAPTRANMFLAGLSTFAAYPASVSNSEGTNGLPYFSDPRTQVVIVAAPASPAVTDIRYQPKKFLPASTTASTFTAGGVTYTRYTNDGSAAIPIATGIEARLIEAEAALHGGGGNWLTILNRLRTDGTMTGTSAADTAACAPTLPPCANRGVGGVYNLPALADPGSDSARVSMLFQERAYWLFLTGYRQGDLRRLVRQYNRPQETVYPIGLWGPSGAAPYGTDVNVPVPYEEQQYNSLYGGCFNRDA